MRGPLSGALEPLAVAETDKVVKGLPPGSAVEASDLALLSIAISLKRIADAMPSDLGSIIHNAITSGIWDARPKQ